MEEYVQHGTSSQLPTLVVISLFLGMGKGGVPGLATIATAATVVTAPTHIPNGLGYAVALMVPILTMIDIYAAYLHQHALDWNTIYILLPLSFVGMILGQYVAERYLTDKGARLFIGLLLLFILALRTWKQMVSYLFPSWAIENHFSGDCEKDKESDDEDKEEDREDETVAVHMPLIDRKNEGNVRLDAMESGESNKSDDDPSTTAGLRNITTTRRKASIDPTKRLVWACFVGLMGGMATMLTNSMGPILNVYLLSIAELTPQSYVGTRAMFFCFLNVGKLPIRVMGGSLGLPMMPLAFGLGAVSVLGVFLAKPIMLSINERLFVKLELSVVAFAGLRLCYMGIKS
mmetsp:Transcript_15018/g.22513  ORF Transcript_15018/g.22513 Transcript_15018/m.22513 type:complete len:346 (+) Transcript_15018:125-1162(+)